VARGKVEDLAGKGGGVTGSPRIDATGANSRVEGRGPRMGGIGGGVGCRCTRGVDGGSRLDARMGLRWYVEGVRSASESFRPHQFVAVLCASCVAASTGKSSYSPLAAVVLVGAVASSVPLHTLIKPTRPSGAVAKGWASNSAQSSFEPPLGR
jgi:hypothetical protein